MEEKLTRANNPKRTIEFLNQLEDYINKCKGCRVRELMGVIGRNRSTVNYYLSILIDEGRIRRTNRDGHWQYYPIRHVEVAGDNVTKVNGNRTVHLGTHRNRVVPTVDAMHSGKSISGHRREGVEYA